VGQRRGHGRSERIHPHRSQREDLKVDGCFVHRGDATGAQIEELGTKLSNRRGNVVAGAFSGFHKRLGNEVFF
jgi:hypothetical protein